MYSRINGLKYLKIKTSASPLFLVVYFRNLRLNVLSYLKVVTNVHSTLQVVAVADRVKLPALQHLSESSRSLDESP